jgi:hypothetical protein
LIQKRFQSKAYSHHPLLRRSVSSEGWQERYIAHLFIIAILDLRLRIAEGTREVGEDIQKKHLKVGQ